MINKLTKDSVVNVPYGKHNLELRLRKGTALLEPSDPEKIITPEGFRQNLEHYLENAGLDLSHPVLVVTDKTRWCDYPDYLPVLAEVVNDIRGNHSPFQIIIAYGTHPPQSEQECRTTYGPLYDQWPFTHHDCHDGSLFVEIGTTPAGTPVRMRKELLDASAVITMGPICHHYFAGYGGGRKLIFPGCGEREAIYRNHGLFLDRQNKQLAPACQPGLLEGNPVATDLFDIESFRPADLAIHGLQDSHGTICDFLIGTGRQIYLDGCSIHGDHYEVQVPGMDTVLASCGGFPKDINFIQTHKTIHNGAAFVRDGGQLVIFAECKDGIGSQTFLPWYSYGSYENAFARLCEHYEGNGGTALAMMAKTRRIRIALVTSLEPETCDLLGVERWSVTQAQEYISGNSNCAWIDNASLLVNKPGG
jgi:nickel-dependent lactate racemase